MTRDLKLRAGNEPVAKAAQVPSPAVSDRDDEEPPAPSLRTPVIAGLAAIVIGLGGFGGWAFSAQLASAAVATGAIVVDSRRKTVSHLEGGILKMLLAQEGEMVKAGQPVVRMEDTRAKAELEQLRARRIGLEARLVRLRAEQGHEQSLVFPAYLVESKNPIAAEVMRAERNVFQSRKEMYQRKVDIQRRTIEQQEAERLAAIAQAEANDRQAELLDRELKAITSLYEKGYAARPKVSELQTRESELIGRRAELVSRRAKAEQAKSTAELEILAVESDFQQQVAADLQQAQLELADTMERLTASEDVLRRVDVVSPQDGIVTNIRTHTPGGVITPGQPLLDIVPENEPLVVEVKVGLRDIDSVRVGAPVQVRLTAYNNRSVAPLAGKLTYLSADQQEDTTNNSAFFVARAEILPQSLAAHPDVRLYPGMPAEVLIVNRSRRAIDYILSPISESFNRAFREE